MLRIYLFGQPHMVHDGRPLTVAGLPKTLPCCAYLLLHRGASVRRETLAFTLWPDASEAQARANLRRHLYDLRRILPPAPAEQPWLLITADTVRWNPDSAYWLDVATFEQLSLSPATIADAVAVYSADLLENEYDDWFVYERERLHTMYVSHLQLLTGDSRRRRDYPQAIGYAHQLLQHEPFSEDIVRQLMAAHYEAGDRGGALHDYEQFAGRLAEALGVEPMPETSAVYTAILHNRQLPGMLPPPDVWSDDGGEARQPALPFAGREVELAQLHGRWQRAARGHGDVVLISGEAGIGKTRMATELAQQADAEGGRVLLGHTSFAEPMPYQALVAALRAALPLLDELEIEPLWRAVLAPILPELRVLQTGGAEPDVPTLPALDPERERMRLFEAFARCLIELARPRPLLLILEDLHWAGAATAAVIEFLARRLRQHAILILLTYREEETVRAHPLRDLRRRLQPQKQLHHVALGRLPLSAVTTLVAQIPAFVPADTSLSQRLYVESEGQPFFLTEIIRDLLETQPAAVEGEGGQAVPAHRGPARGIRVLIAGRVARLSGPARAIAEVAAVVGDAFAVELVRSVSGRDEHQVLDDLGELLDRGLISEVTGRGRADFVFTHHLIQSAIYADVLIKQRTRRHRRVAQVMAELYAAQLDEVCGQIAVHYDRGNEPRLATRYYLQAARHAIAVYADDVALYNLGAALLLGPDDRTRFALIALRATVYSRRGEREAEQADLGELAALAQALADEDGICDILQRHITLQRALGDREGEARSIMLLQERAAASGRLRWWAEALQAGAGHELLLGHFAAARTRIVELLAMRDLLNDAAGMAVGYALLAEAAALQGSFAEAQTLLQQARTRAGEQANHSVVVRTLHAAAVAATTRVDIDAAYALGHEMLELCRTLGDREGEADAYARIAAAAVRLFRVEEARRCYGQAEALYELSGNRRGQAAVLVNAGMLAANLGHYADGITASRRAEVLFTGLQDLRGQTVSAINLAAHALRQGDFATSKRAATRALTRARELATPVMEAYALANLGAAERELGEFDAAIAHMQAGLALRRSLDQPVELATDLCDLTIAYLRAGDVPAAGQTTDEMLGLLRAAAEHMTYPQFILWAAAQTYRALSEPARATSLLAEAYAVLQAKVGAIPDTESRATFLQLPYNRELTAAFERGEWL